MSGYVRKVYRGKSSLNAIKPLLGWLDIELTERCNNDCIHCYINLPENDEEIKKKELKTEEIKEILVEAASLGCLTVRFTGGEPLLKEDFEEIYRFTRCLGMRVVLFTNARLIDNQIAELFSCIPPLDEIEVSVYGMTKEVYDSVARTTGAYDEFRRGVSLLLEKNIPFVGKTVLIPKLKAEFKDFRNWAESIPWMKKEPGITRFLDLRTRRDSESRNRMIRSLRMTKETYREELSRFSQETNKEMKTFCASFSKRHGGCVFSCNAGLGRASVDAYGKLQMCIPLRHPDTVYDLKKGNLSEAMLSFFPKVREMKAERSEYLDTCARCPMKDACEQCPAKSWGEFGTLDQPVPYLCEMTHIQAIFLGLIRENEKIWEFGKEEWSKRVADMESREC